MTRGCVTLLFTMTALAGPSLFWSTAHSTFAVVGVLSMPYVLMFGRLCLTLFAQPSQRPSQWIASRQWLQVGMYCVLAAWWVLWELGGRSGQVSRVAQWSGIDSSFAEPILFIGPLASATAVAYLISYYISAHYLA